MLAERLVRRTLAIKTLENCFFLTGRNTGAVIFHCLADYFTLTALGQFDKAARR